MGGRPLAVHEYKIRFLFILGAPGVEKTNPVIPICNESTGLESIY